MAWTDITYKCGHTGEIQMYGPNKERVSKAAWYTRTVLCPECQAKARAEAATAAESDAKASGLPELIGSAKQIEWAMAIRQKALSDLNALARTDRDRAIVVELGRIAVSASEWIDNRDNYGAMMRKHCETIKANLGL